ncbi:Beta-1,3-galactosyltransferase 15 [Auxenochlorella protothecoides]|uniref:Hexosyltransferase n=1 Tax=Auxenochlorella protothecoides TaxID=3075 RepID=A0A087SPZ6_AUXPR|nr:Beta-1,3-galactosyltransferase 15 [Auxenochlorella protothecoides]KFM27800.1 Beta-1,3-galactosyltransferase 15 [Auxenochlorella protothecoides]RMZ54454.1 hypothetical protein APUTEX25_002030 [Auxenochlorella protothecoides]|eukprot:RMZ54454.1 hypothetical protein APUTEX25_002030 [Auxenochlorella protothecoides]
MPTRWRAPSLAAALLLLTHLSLGLDLPPQRPCRRVRSVFDLPDFASCRRWGAMGAEQARRDAIRATWGSHPALHAVRFFLAAPADPATLQQVEAEVARHGDVTLLRNVAESYFNITHQTLAALRAAAHDRAATHVLKADDDSYVRVAPLLDRIRAAPAERLFLGFVERPGGGPHRDPHSRWHVTPEEWPGDRYPPWAHGAGYVLSADLARGVERLVRPPLFKLEDVAVGEWVERVAADEGGVINYERDERFNFNGCRVHDLVSHYISPAGQRCLWDHLGNCMRCLGAHMRTRTHQ